MGIRQRALEDLAVTLPTPDAGFWSGRRVLVTGHTGFKGAWLCLWLSTLGAKVSALALPATTDPNLFESARIAELLDHHVCDIRDRAATAALIRRTEPELVLHLAAQALVRTGYREPVETFATNVMGTAHVLDALRDLPSVRVALMVTTDKVYRNVEGIYPYRERDPLGGHDPYSASKAAAEMVIASYRQAFLQAQGVAVAAARAGNVIGGGDWSEDRLVPDAVKAWQAGRTLHVRRPEALRPWQHVLEPLAGYLLLSERLWRGDVLSTEFNFGPDTGDAGTVRQVVEAARAAWGGAAPVEFSSRAEGPHEAGLLALEISRARVELGYRPRWSRDESIVRTMRWYRGLAAGTDARKLCEADLVAFGNAA